MSSNTVFDLENIHQQNLNDLVKKFGTEKAKEFYQSIRKELEEKANVKDFIPTLTYNKVQMKMKEIG